MKLSLQHGLKKIPFEVIYRNRKTMSIQVEPPNIVKVIVPKATPKEIILEVVKNKETWILQKLTEMKTIKYIGLNKKFENGEPFMYLGREYPLKIILDQSLKRPEVKLYQDELIIRTSNKETGLLFKAIESWYRDRALKQVKERINYFQNYFNVKPTNIVVKEQKKRWASCTSKKKLLFNWRIIMTPPDVLDYVVVHEMCHMVHMNHSKEFWALVESILPDYKTRRGWLKKCHF